jgi:hypothetical protein
VRLTIGRGAAAVLLTASVLLANTARAQTLESARALYFAAEFEPALAEFRTIAASPTSTREDLVEALRYLVPLEQTLGRPMDAAECARALLALAPETTLPEGSPASAVEAFEALRTDVGPAELRLALTETRASVSLLGPLGVVPSLRLSCAGGTPADAVGPSTMEVTLALDPLIAAACDAVGLSAAGAPLLTAHAERAATTVLVPEPEPPPERAPEPFPWIVVGAVAGAVVVVTVVAVVVAVLVTPSGQSVSLPSPIVVGW